MLVHQKLKAGKFPNCRKLAQELEVSAKTIQLDVDFMHYGLGLPMECDQPHFGFYFYHSAPVTHFPAIDRTRRSARPTFVAKIGH